MNQASERDAILARREFARRRIMTLEEVAGLVHASVPTARRRLRQWKAVNSYNRNGRYYALPDVPEFDGDGLWSWQGASFSRHGNLRQALVALVERSPAGLDAGELGRLLGLNPRSFLSAFATDPGLRREKERGRFVYYGADPAVRSAQRGRRRASQEDGREATPAEAVAILVEKLKHPALGEEALCRKLRKRGVPADAGFVRAFLARHGLAQKKTPSST